MKKLIILLFFFPFALYGQKYNVHFVKTAEGAAAMRGADTIFIAPPFANRTTFEDIFGYYNVKDFGAIGNYTHDDTQAVKDALTAAGEYGTIFFPEGTYKLTSTVEINNAYTIIAGEGKGATRIVWEPADDTVCFKFVEENPANILDYCEIRDLEIVTWDHVGTKTAIEIWHATGFSASNVYIANFFSDIDGDCIGLHLNGHESCSFSNITISADRPVFIDNYWGCDHFSFTDCLFIGLTSSALHPLIEVADSMEVADLSFNGRQAWTGGLGGFYYLCTDNTVTNICDISFNNVRWEQGTSSATDGPSGWAVHIDAEVTAHDLNFNNFYEAERKGIRLSNVDRVMMSNVRLNPDGADSSLYLTSDVTNVVMDNVTFGEGAGSFSRSPSYASANTFTTIKKTIGHPGQTGRDFAWTSVANTTPQNLDLGAIIPEKARIVAIEMICIETAPVADLSFKIGNASAGDQFVASANCDTEDRVIGIIDATKPAAVIMDWDTATHIWIQGIITTTLWDAVNAGEWVIFITYRNYDSPYDPAIQ